MMIDVFEETIPDEILFYAIELYFIFALLCFMFA
jgi:hypothetical protein